VPEISKTAEPSNANPANATHDRSAYAAVVAARDGLARMEEEWVTLALLRQSFEA
jgi:hypothetical protein